MWKFVERHSFRIVSHQEIKWNYSVLRSATLLWSVLLQNIRTRQQKLNCDKMKDVYEALVISDSTQTFDFRASYFRDPVYMNIRFQIVVNG